MFNFHPTQSFTDYRVGTDWAGEYQVVLSSDDKEFGGHANIDKTVKHFTTPMEWNGRKNFMQVRPCRSSSRARASRRRLTLSPPRAQLYLPSRTVQVLAH